MVTPRMSVISSTMKMTSRAPISEAPASAPAGMSPKRAASWAALRSLRRSGFLGGEEDVVLFSTGAGVKYEPPL